jgi:hypothetical protein
MKDQAAKGCRKDDGDGDEAAGSRGTSALEREDGEGGGEVAGPDGRSVLVSTAGRKEEVAKGCRKGEGDGDEAAGSRGTEREDVVRWPCPDGHSPLVSIGGRKEEVAKG